MTVVATCQLAPRIGEPEHNRALMRDAVREAAQRGAQVVVLPELANSGYVFRDLDEARALAEPLDGPTVVMLSELAAEHALVIVAGLCERDADVVHNSAVLIEDGLRAVYRKAHLWNRERLVFAAGDEPPPVVDTRHGRIGMVVCYDLEFPEWVRLPALAGAELVCAPVNWPASPAPPGERTGEVVRAQAAASTNRIYLAVADRTGAERGVEWQGASMIIDPAGFPLGTFADCDLALARDKRISEHNDVLADRRPELYSA